MFLLILGYVLYSKQERKKAKIVHQSLLRMNTKRRLQRKVSTCDSYVRKTTKISVETIETKVKYTALIAIVFCLAYYVIVNLLVCVCTFSA